MKIPSRGVGVVANGSVMGLHIFSPTKFLEWFSFMDAEGNSSPSHLVHPQFPCPSLCPMDLLC